MIVMLLSEKVTFFMILLFIFCLIISGEAEWQLFFILFYLSLLFLHQLVGSFSSRKLRLRMNLIIFIGMIIFIWIMIERVREIIANA